MAAALLVFAGCAEKAAPPRSSVWVVGRTEPAFDPDGPPDATRWAIERLLTQGLVEEDSSGRVAPAAATSVEVSADSLTYTFHLKPKLRFTDGTPCVARHFAEALEVGLARSDHGTRAWLLGAVRGVDRVRAGRPLPPLGIEIPNEATLVVSLSRPDPLLLAKLALPGVSSAWSRRGEIPWSEAIGLGPYRVVRSDPARRLDLAWALPRGGVQRAGDGARSAPAARPPDTLSVRFVIGAARVRSILRSGGADLAWPLPPGLLEQPLPSDFGCVIRPARPTRRLLLVMRADLPPTSKLAARHALTHGINLDRTLGELGRQGEPSMEWIAGAGPFEFPKLDRAALTAWMNEGDLGRSFHVDMAYDADGPAAEVARGLQGEWSRVAIYVDLMPLRGEKLASELERGQAHLLLVDSQSLTSDLAGEVAPLVMPMRGPAVGSFRSGWRTRDLDPWLAPARGASPPALDDLQWRLDEERVALPVARLPWVWAERGGQNVSFHPRFGPNPAGL